MRLGLGNNLVKTAFPIGTSPSLDLAFALDRSFTTDPAAAGNALITSRRGPAAKFSRGSGATQVNAAGLIEYAPENLLVRSEEFNEPIWLKSNSVGVTPPVVTPNQVPSPIGNLTADKIDLPAVSAVGSYSMVSQLITQTIGFNFKFSVYLRGQNGGESVWVMWTPNGSTYTRTECVLTTSWQRFDIGYVSAAGQNYCQIGVDLRDASQSARPTQTIYAWGAQVERASTARTYYPTTTAAFYGPRFDHDPATGDSNGLLIEEPRENFALHSQSFANTYWNAFSTASATDNITISPSGVASSASRITANSGTDPSRYRLGLFSITAGSSPRTASVFLKAGTHGFGVLILAFNKVGAGAVRSSEVRVNLATGSAVQTGTLTGFSFSVTQHLDGWWRIALSATSNASTAVEDQAVMAFGLSFNATGTSGAFAGTETVFGWGAQLEAGADPTSYIPTTSGTAARSADVCSIIGTDFTNVWNTTEGSTLVNASSMGPATTSIFGAATFILDIGSSSSERLTQFIQLDLGKIRPQIKSANVTIYEPTLVNLTANTTARQSLGFKVGETTSAYLNNVAYSGGTNLSLVMPVATGFYIGVSSVGGNRLNGHIARIQYFRKRLSNAKLQELTYPDDDADAYIAKVELMLGGSIYSALPNATSDAKRIITDFVKAEKAASRWALHKRIFLPIYNNAAASAVDMVSATSGTFFGTVTHAAGYVQGDGFTGYFDSGIGLPAVGGSNASGSMWRIIPQRVTGVSRFEGVNGPGTERVSLGTNATDFSQFLLPSVPTVAQTPTTETSAGIEIGSTTSTSSRFIKFRKAGAFSTGSNTTLDTTVIPSGDLFFLARNNNDAGINNYHTERRGGYGFGLGLTEAQAEGYAANLETLYEGLTGIALP